MLMRVENLKVHPKNSEYFSEPSAEEYETLRRSIAEHGIRDPLKVLPDGTVIAGSLRLRVAKELDFTEVPVEIWDVPKEEAEYLLVADNEERRFCKDPMRRAKRAEFLTRYWKMRLGRGGYRRSSMTKLVIDKTGPCLEQQKTIRDIAEAIGENVRMTRRLLTLNRLIPELQEMVSAGTLSVSRAYEIALLDPETQKALLQIGEERLSDMKVKEIEGLRKELAAESKRASEAERKIEALKSELEKAVRGSARADQLEAEIERLRRENGKLKSSAVERVVERVVYRPDPEREAEIARLREEVERLRGSLDAEVDEEIRKKRWELERLKAEEADLEVRLKAKRSGAALMDLLRKLMRPLEKAREEFADRITTSELSEAYAIEMRGWVGLLRWYAQRLEDTTRYVDVRVIRDMLEGKGESGDGDGR